MNWPFNKPRPIARTGDSKPVGNIYQFVWRMSGRHQIYISLVALAVASISVAPIELQRRIINGAIEQDDLTLLLVLGGIYLGVILLRRVLKFLLAMYQGWLSESAVRYCRETMTEIALSEDGDLEQVKERKSLPVKVEGKGTVEEEADGQVVSVIRSEIDQVGQFVGTGISDPVASIAKLLFGIGYMLYVEPLVTLIALAFFVPQILAVPLLQKVLNRLIRKRTDLLRDLSDALVQEKKGEADDWKSYNDRLDAIFKNRMGSVFFKQLIKALVNILNSLAPLSVLVFGGYMVINDQTSIGIIVAFMSGFERLADPTRALVDYYRLASIKNEQHGKIAEWIVAETKES